MKGYCLNGCAIFLLRCLVCCYCCRVIAGCSGSTPAAAAANPRLLGAPLLCTTTGAEHQHDSSVSSLSFRFSEPMVKAAMEEFIEEMLKTKGESMLACCLLVPLQQRRPHLPISASSPYKPQLIVQMNGYCCVC